MVSFFCASGGRPMRLGKDEATASAHLASTRLARPITAFWSCTQEGIPRRAAAMMGGKEG